MKIFIQDALDASQLRSDNGREREGKGEGGGGEEEGEGKREREKGGGRERGGVDIYITIPGESPLGYNNRTKKTQSKESGDQKEVKGSEQHDRGEFRR